MPGSNPGCDTILFFFVGFCLCISTNANTDSLVKQSTDDNKDFVFSPFLTEQVIKVAVKQSRYRPGVAQRVPGS